jgi:putative transposase
MKKMKHSESKIVHALKEHEQGKSASDICRELDIHKVTFYAWCKHYSGLESQDLRKLKELEEETVNSNKYMLT